MSSIAFSGLELHDVATNNLQGPPEDATGSGLLMLDRFQALAKAKVKKHSNGKAATRLDAITGGWQVAGYALSKEYARMPGGANLIAK